jgi:hypothetical protein
MDLWYRQKTDSELLIKAVTGVKRTQRQPGNVRLRDAPGTDTYSPERYATNTMAKIPSKVAIAVIAIVRFTGAKRIRATMTNISMTAALKFGRE